MMMFSGATDVEFALPLGPFLIRPGVLAGVRAFSIPAPQLQITCGPGLRSPAYPCAATAWSNAQWFVEPRVRVSVKHFPLADAFAGYDAVGGGTVLGLAGRLDFARADTRSR